MVVLGMQEVLFGGTHFWCVLDHHLTFQSLCPLQAGFI